MLCPTHNSSQLPSDMPQSQSRKKSKSSAERFVASGQCKHGRYPAFRLAIHFQCGLYHNFFFLVSSPSRKSCLHQDKVKTYGDCKDSSPSQWKSQKKFKNLVICCSALTNTEKVINQ